MKANVEEVVGVHVEEDVVAVGDVGLARILLMVRIPLVATMVSLESIKLQKMESLEGPLRGEVVDSVALVEGSVGDAEVALAMRKVPKLIALAEYMIDEVEQDTGKLFCWNFFVTKIHFPYFGWGRVVNLKTVGGTNHEHL